MEVEGQQNSSNCPKCLKSPDENMISCIECQKSYHTSCTNATSEQISNLTYKCPTCNTVPPESIKSASTRSSNKFEERSIRLKLQRLEEERAVSMEFISKKYQIIDQHEKERHSETSSNRSLSIQNWLTALPNASCAEAPVQTDVRSISENPNKNKETEQETVLPDENIYLNTPSHIGNKNPVSNSRGINKTLQENYCLNNPSDSTHAAKMSSSAPGVQQASGSAIINGLQRRLQPYSHSVGLEPTVSTFINPLINSGAPCNSFQNAFNRNANQNIFHQPHTSTSRNLNPPSHHLNDAIINYIPRLNQDQLQARNSLPRELPAFSGQPEEWPLFSSTFEWSTKICGYTDAENFIRLQKSLRGDALQKIQHLLVHPSNVNWVMSILKLLYGQPEKIITSIKNRIKSTPTIDENNLPSFTSFAINVKGLIGTIEASKLTNELNNSSLLQELIQKLPPSYQLQWGTFKLQLINQNKDPNLYEFSNWIFNIGLSASCIPVENSYNGKKKMQAVNNSNNKKAYIHTHNEDRKCFVCNNNNCRTISNCQKFLSLSREDKWNIVRKNKFCRICLFKHYGKCKKARQCGVQGCKYYHHSGKKIKK